MSGLMADIVSEAVRSRMMSGIRGKNTKPEMLLRKGLHRLGFRFRLHDRKLPGKPDLVFPKYKAVIFAHGCFWHGHDCHLFKWPATRAAFWREKIGRNRIVDQRSEQALNEAGWRYGIVWECALKGKARIPVEDILARCTKWLRQGEGNIEIRGE